MKKFSAFFLVCCLITIMVSCSEEPVSENVFGSLSGKVVEEGENGPLANVKITTSPASNTVFTDAEGIYAIEQIQIGEYSVQAELEGFQTAFEAANVSEGNTSNVIFELSLEGANNMAPDVPILLFPSDSILDVATETEFVWSSSDNDDDEISYTLELRNGSTNEVRLFESLKDTTLIVVRLDIGVNYFWQVTADDDVSGEVKSALGSFSTRTSEANRYLYVRTIDGNNVIFSGGESTGDEEEDANQNELRLTDPNTNSFRPARNTTVNKIAFLRLVGGETHLFTINSDGTEIKQVTSAIPVAGFRQNELEFSWYDNGGRLYYPNFNKLYSIAADGSGNRLEYQVDDSRFITEMAVNPLNSLVALKTNDANGYEARVVIVNPSSDSVIRVVAEDYEGALGGLDFSANGGRILYTRDVSGVENSEYRQLDSRIFEYLIEADTTLVVDTNKLQGTNDLDAKYAPDDGAIIFTNTSNDGISEKRIYRTISDDVDQRRLLFTDAFMPNWE